MALCSQIVDAGTDTPRRVRWGWWHIVVMTEAAQSHVPETEGLPLLEVWSHPALSGGLTITYPMGFKDPADGEVFSLTAGDRLSVGRDR